MSEAKPTKGEWLLELAPNGGWCLFVGPTFDMDTHRTIASRGQWPLNVAESHANAVLLHDAGNTYNTTGLTPSQFVERVKELEGVLQAAVDCGIVPKSSAADGGASKYSAQVLVADRIRAALSKARPNTAEGE